MKPQELQNLLNRAAAAIETPDDLTADEKRHVVEDLLAAAIPNVLVASLASYVSADDAELDRKTFLLLVADRIREDVSKTQLLTQVEFSDADMVAAKKIATRLGYTQTAYTSSSALWGLFCLPDRPSQHRGCIIRTKELGLLFVQDTEDLLIKK